MSHGYVKANYGCNCFYGDSSFKRYNRAHLGGDVIFNYTNNYGGCCGGHGNFWTGFGVGVGNWLGNLFCGGFNGLFGGLFGGFGGFGGGFGGFGGNWFGGGITSPWSAGTSTRASNQSTKEKVITNEVKDKDYKTINDYDKQADELRNNANAKRDDIVALKTRLEELRKNLDGIQDGQNKNQIDAIIKRLEEKLNTLQSAPEGSEDPLAPAVTTSPEDSEADPAAQTKPENAGSEPAVTTGTDGSVTLTTKGADGKPVTTPIATVNDLANVTPEMIAKMDADTAAKILDKLGYTEGEAPNKVGKLANDYKVLLLLEKSGLQVKVEKRDESRDTTITGKIDSVKQEKDGKLSYNVDCNNSNGIINGKYHFASTNTENTMYNITADAEWSDKVSVQPTAQQSIRYNPDAKVLINESGKVLVTRKSIGV